MQNTTGNSIDYPVKDITQTPIYQVQSRAGAFGKLPKYKVRRGLGRVLHYFKTCVNIYSVD
jgi:hypothetical protein